jgi:hypothetical protein
MKHIDVTGVCLVRIASLAYQVLNHEKVPKKGCEMHCSEAVFAFALCIHPVFKEFSVQLVIIIWMILKLTSITILKNMFTNYLYCFSRILKSCKMQWFKSFTIINLWDIQKATLTAIGRSRLTSDHALAKIIELHQILQQGL